MDNKWRNQTLALAGVTQAVMTMDELARTGYLKTQPFTTAVNSLFITNPQTAEEVFGNRFELELGLDSLISLLNNRRDKQGTTLIGYCLGILHLQKKLVKNKKMLGVVSERLEKARHQVEHFGPTHDNVISNLAEVYSSTVSTFPFRIQVVGEYQYLQQPRVANQVRVLLLAAIRAATLWRQTGGSRWSLLINKKAILSETEQMLKDVRDRNVSRE